MPKLYYKLHQLIDKLRLMEYTKVFVEKKISLAAKHEYSMPFYSFLYLT